MTKGAHHENPTVTWFYPDKTLANDAELKDVEIGDMVLLHEDDIHFNLFVPKTSNLATMGSLSYRHNIGPMMKKNLVDEDFDENEEEKDKKELNDLKKELKRCKESKCRIEKEYVKCVQQL